jgi:hypothetical protein
MGDSGSSGWTVPTLLRKQRSQRTVANDSRCHLVVWDCADGGRPDEQTSGTLLLNGIVTSPKRKRGPPTLKLRAGQQISCNEPLGCRACTPRSTYLIEILVSKRTRFFRFLRFFSTRQNLYSRTEVDEPDNQSQRKARPFSALKSKEQNICEVAANYSAVALDKNVAPTDNSPYE